MKTVEPVVAFFTRGEVFTTVITLYAVRLGNALLKQTQLIIPCSSSLSLTAVDFIRGGVVPAVVVAVADEGVADAASVLARELGGGVTRGEGAALLVAVVAAVVGVVADVAERDAAAVVTGEVDRCARVEGLAGGTTQCIHQKKERKKSKRTTGHTLTAHSLQLVRVVAAVVEAVAFPPSRDAVAVEAGELIRLTAFAFVFDAVFAVVGQVPLPLLRTLALWTRRTCEGSYGRNLRTERYLKKDRDQF